MRKKGLRLCLYIVAAVFACLGGAKPMHVEASSPTVTASTKKSVTISWTPKQDDGFYSVLGYKILDKNTDKYICTVNDPKASSATITGLRTGYKGYWSVYYVVKRKRTGSERTGFLGSCYVNTSSLDKAKVSEFRLSDMRSQGDVMVVADNPYASQSYNRKVNIQVKFYKRRGNKWKKCGTYTGSGSGATAYTSYIKVSANTAYRYQIRYYSQNALTGKNYYGGWSGYRYFVSPGANKSKVTASGSGITFQLKKGAGIKKYKIYLSKDQKSWSCVRTVNVTSKSKKTIKATIKKYKKKSLKKGTTYYYKIVPYVVGSKKSDAAELSDVTIGAAKTSGSSASSSRSSGSSGSSQGRRRCHICHGSGQCGVCLGDGGEWAYSLGLHHKKTWVKCRSCYGSGNCKYCTDGWKY